MPKMEPPGVAEPRYVVFVETGKIADGPRDAAARAAKAAEAAGGPHPVVIDCASGEPVDLDISAPAPRGRPRLGVTAREVTLLPRHWDWLARQPGGASAALRRLVETARKETSAADARRERRDAAYRAMRTLAGDLPGFEEAARRLFADDRTGLVSQIAPWPADVVDLVRDLLGLAGGD